MQIYKRELIKSWSKHRWKIEKVMMIHTDGGKMEPKRPVEEDEVEVEYSLGPKRWSKFMVDEEEPPTCFLLLAMCKVYGCIIINKLRFWRD